MKPWIAPIGLSVMVAVVVAFGQFVGAQPIPAQVVSESSTRVSVVCPSFESATASVRVAAIGIDQPVRTSKLSAPQKVTEAAGLAIVEDPGQPVRVSVQRSEAFGATTVASASAGPARGLSAASCLSPRAEHWFAGVDATQRAQSDLILVNLDSTEAVVDLTAYGPTGRLAAPRGLSVDGSSAATISLGVIARQQTPITLKVTTSQGRVAAFVRQLVWNGRDPFGGDWVPASSAPGRDLILPGIPAGTGKRNLVVTNPGERTAGVDISVLTSAGLNQLSEVQQLDVPPGATRSVELAAGLAGEAAGLRLTSNQPVSAGLLVDNGLGADSVDATVIGAAPAIPADGVWPLAVGETATTVLQLANPSEAEAVVKVVTDTGSGSAPKVTEVKVLGGAMGQLALPKAGVLTLRIQTDSTQMRGAVVITSRLDQVKGIAVLDLAADATRVKGVDVVFDPHLG